MKSFLLTSILIATIAIPLIAARDTQPRRGLVRAVVGFIAFESLYLIACLWIYPRLS